jgi:hypothetical protein
MKSQKIIDYYIFVGYRDDMIENVKLFLQKGWRPWGAPILKDSNMFVQAMVKYESDNDE